MHTEKPRIAVIGGGVNGIGSALAILQSVPNAEVKVYSECFSPFTTGDGSAGFWTPYCLEGTPMNKVFQWAGETWDLFDTWYKKNKPGILLTPVRRVAKQELKAPEWNHIPLDYREMSQDELKEFGPDYISGHTYFAYIAKPTHFLPPMMEAIKSLGGQFERRNVRRLEDLGDRADIIVNCAGVWSRDLVPDSSVYPTRGQVMRVRAPWLNRVTFDLSEGTCAYIIPNDETVVLGGTCQENNWRTTVDAEDTKTIWKNCSNLEPELKTNSEIVGEWVGLRPSRKGGVRLEEDAIFTHNKRIPVVHNYGHGGSGVTFFWGCSLEVRDLIGKIIHRHFAQANSKL